MCWGRNDHGQLGVTASAFERSPVNANGLMIGQGTSYNISVGGYKGHTCMMLNGSVECWGGNRVGLLGSTLVQGSTHQGVAINFTEGRTVKSISAGGESHACAVLDDDSVYCWGNGYYGQVGDGLDFSEDAPKLIMCGTNQYAGSTSCTNCPSGKVNPAGDAVYGSGTGTCELAPPPASAPPSEPECVAPTSHSLLTDSCAACFAGFYTSNSSVYYDCLMNWIYYFSPEYVTFDGSQPTWNGGAYLHHNGGREDPAGDWLYSSTWMYAASATFKGFNCSTGDLSDGLVPSNLAGVDAAVVYDQNVDGGTWQYSSGGGDYGTNQWVMDNLCAPDCACASPSSPSVPEPTPAASVPPPPAAQAEKEAAETTRDSILADFSDARLKAKVKLLADAAIAGVKVQRLSAKISAADENAACTDAFSKAGMSAGDGACVATAASSGKRRRLHSTTYDVELMFSASTVSDDAIKAAELEMKNNGVQGVTSQTSLEPITELKTVPGVDTGKLQTFETEAQAAAAAAVPSATPPPAPPPPKPNLVLDDDDAAMGHSAVLTLVVAAAAVLLLQ